MLEIVTESSDRQLTTTSAVKDMLGITSTSDDSLIDALITQASQWAENYIGQGPLTVQSYRETLSGFGGRRMMLSRRPVRALPSLWSATDTGAATTILSSEFKVDHAAGLVERDAGFAWDAPAVPKPFAIPLDPAFWPGEEMARWLSDYKAGWTYAGISTGSDNYSTVHGTTSTGRTLPEDIEEAVIHRTASVYGGEAGVEMRKVGDLQIKYATGSDGMPFDPAAALLDTYRSVV